MRSILRADFFRMWKSKSTIIALIVACAAPLVINLLYFLIFIIGKSLSGEQDVDMLGLVINARTIISMAYSTGNNMGFIIPMFSAIFICSDMNSGMLRNKIIAGKPRKQIFFSYLICGGFLNVILITAYTTLLAAFSLLFFNYGLEFTGEEVINLVFYIISGTVAYLFLSTVSLFFSLTTGNSALSIIFTIVFCFALGIITTVIMLVPFTSEQYDVGKYFLAVVPTYTATLETGGAENIPTFIEGLCSMIGFGAVNACLAYNIFVRKELK